MAAILKNRAAGDRLIETQVGMLMQNHVPMTTHRSKLKQGIEFQYGDRPFSQTGSSFISTLDWDNSSKFSMHIDFHHFERMQSLNLNSEVDFRLYDRHHEKSIWHQKSADVCPITINQSINLYRAIVQRRVLQCSYAESKKNVLRRILNVLTDGAVRQFSGREFQSLGAATEKRRAAVSKLCAGTDRNSCGWSQQARLTVWADQISEVAWLLEISSQVTGDICLLHSGHGA